MTKISARAEALVYHPKAQNGIIVLIVLNAIALGMETSDVIMIEAERQHYDRRSLRSSSPRLF